MRNVHLSYEDRTTIERCLKEGRSFKETGQIIGKSPSTVSKEIKKHRRAKSRNTAYEPNNCKYRRECIKNEHCQHKCCDRSKCHKCSQCLKYCHDYEPMVCPKLVRGHLVCDGCPDYQHCRYDKFYYNARLAQDDYERILRESRTGINMSEEEFAELSEIICPLIENKQSVAHILMTHGNKINISERTLYTYIADNRFRVRNIDLPRSTRYKKRKPRNDRNLQNSEWRNGRTYQDYLGYIKENPCAALAQMDTVEGKKGVSQKVLLTLNRPDFCLLLAFIMDNKTRHEVKMALDALEYRLGKELFQTVFPVILADNGVEFQNPEYIENSVYGGKRTKVFYCDPYSSFQKGAIENSHQMIRRIIPKGGSMNSFTQTDIDKMINHINNYHREALNGKSPFQAARAELGVRIMRLLNLSSIRPEYIVLKPSLLLNHSQKIEDEPRRNLQKMIIKRLVNEKRII